MTEDVVTITREHYNRLATDAGPILGEAHAELAYWRGAAREAEAERDRLRGVLRDVLNRFTERGHPGRPCLRTGWQSVEQVEEWRQAAQPVDNVVF